MLAFVFVASPVLSAQWLITTPVTDATFDRGGNIDGNGTGEANQTFIIKVFVGTLQKQAVEETVGPDENWQNIIEPPNPDGVWTNASGTSTGFYHIFKNGVMKDSRIIKIVNEDEA